jgi:hypothetical protein
VASQALDSIQARQSARQVSLRPIGVTAQVALIVLYSPKVTSCSMHINSINSRSRLFPCLSTQIPIDISSSSTSSTYRLCSLRIFNSHNTKHSPQTHLSSIMSRESSSKGRGERKWYCVSVKFLMIQTWHANTETAFLRRWPS